MKKIFLLFAAAIAMSALLSSCDHGEDVLYTNDFSFGKVTSDGMLAGTGVKLIVTEDQTDGGWKNTHRCLFNSDILTIEAANTYNIRLLDYIPSILKKCLIASETSEETYGKDPVGLQYVWGYDKEEKYLDMSYIYTSKKNSSVPHDINLVFDDARSNTDTLFFYLKHNGAGEVFGNKNIQTSDLQVSVGYSSFNIADVLPQSDRNTVFFAVEWDWHKGTEGLSEETEHSGTLMQLAY